MSFFGTMFDIGTFWFLLAGFLLMFFSAIVVGNRQNAKIVLLGLILSFTALFIFQTLRFFTPGALSFQVLGVNKIENLLGAWNAFGIFVGLAALVLLFILEFFSISKIGKWLLGILLLFSLLLVAAVNFGFVWMILGIFALIIFVYKISSFSGGEESAGAEPKKHFPIFSFAVGMVCLLFFNSGQSLLGRYLPSRLGLLSNEVGPTLKATLATTKAVLEAKPVLGTGPNTFGAAWAKYKSPLINNTLFWNVPFNVGSGLFPTLLSTTGYLGILSWLVFLVLFLISGLKSLFANIKNGLNTEMSLFFIAALYLLIASFFYFTGIVLFLLSLAFVGIFIGLHTGSRPEGAMSIGFLNDHRKSFFFILLFVVLIIVSASLAFKHVGRFASLFYFEKVSQADTIPAAEPNIQKALSLYSNDVYLRTYTQIYLIKLNSLVTKSASLTQAEKDDLRTTYTQALGSATLATRFNPENYLNFQTLGAVHSVVTSYGVEGSYVKAIDAYNAALALNPLNPTSKLAMAKVSLAARKVKEAKDYAEEALALKKDYIDALILLSQIATGEGNSKDALSYAETALLIAPGNTDLIKYVNTLRAK